MHIAGVNKNTAKNVLHCDNQWDIFLKGVMVMVFNATFNNISEISWWSVLLAELSIFFKSTSTSLFTGGTFFYKNLNNCHQYPIQHSLKSGGTKDHFRRVKVHGTVSY
jgi:hypothetical protein